jgi:hypothetical protein
LSHRIPEVGELQQGQWLYAFRHDSARLYDIAAAAIKAAQAMEDDDA